MLTYVHKYACVYIYIYIYMLSHTINHQVAYFICCSLEVNDLRTKQDDRCLASVISEDQELLA